MTRYSFNPGDGLVIVAGRIHGPTGVTRARLALDTGATTTILSADLLQATGCDPAAARERVRITTASGVEFAARIPIDRIDALGCQRERFPILCHTLPPSTTVDGLLGLDFFRETALSIDFRDGYVEIS